MRRTTNFLLAVSLFLSIAGCKEGKKGNQALARVNGVELTLDQYKTSEFYYNYLSHLALTNPNQRVQVMVESEVLYQEANNQKLEDLPQVRCQIHQVMINELLRQELAKKEHQTQPTEQEARDYFAANPTRFRSPETVHYAHILISLPDKKSAEALANKLLKDPEINQPAGFGKLALENSADKTTSNTNGDLGYALVPDEKSQTSTSATWQTALIKAAASIKEVGGIYPGIVETERGYHLVKLLGHQQAVTPTFEQVKVQIMHQLAMDGQAKAYRAYVDELKSKDRVLIDSNLVTQLSQSGELNISNRPYPMPGIQPQMSPGLPTRLPPGFPPQGFQDQGMPMRQPNNMGVPFQMPPVQAPNQIRPIPAAGSPAN